MTKTTNTKNTTNTTTTPATSTWHRALAAIHGWAGHMVRCQEPHPGATVVQWRNAKWWEVMKSASANSSDHSWRHPKKNWVRGFEGAPAVLVGEIQPLGAVKIWMNQRQMFVAEAVLFGVDLSWSSLTVSWHCWFHPS